MPGARRPKHSAVNDPSITPLEVGGQFRAITARTNQETDDNQKKISSAKDKAQLSTTGSLSLTLIIVLKQMLEDITTGKGDTMMYISFGLVVLCIALQIAIAFLAIYIYSLMKTAPVPNEESPPSMKACRQTEYSEKIYRTSSDENLLAIEKKKLEKDGKDEDEVATSKEKQSLTSHIMQLFRDLDSSQTKQPWYTVCLPCLKKPAGEKEERYDLYHATLRLHEILTIEKFKASMEFAEAQANVSDYGHVDLEDIDGEDEDPERVKLEKKFEEKWKRLNTVTTQHRLLDLQLDLQYRRKSFKTMFKLQQNLTYLTYVVFIMNSFITGFGLTRGIDESGMNNSTMPVPVTG